MLKFLVLAVLCVVSVSGHIHEHPDPNEPTLFGQVWEDFKQGIDWYHLNKPSDWANLRQAHVKQHGCVRAKLTVDPAINSKLAVGPIFSNPGKSFDIFARFSSGGGAGFIRKGLSTDRADYEHASDTGLDNRAIAFKVFGVNGQSLAPGFDGTTSDWHFTTATCVFTKDGVDGAAYFRAVNRGGLGKFLLTHPKDALKVTSTGLSGKLARDLLNVKYSSTAPFAFGPSNSVKFSLQPFSTNAKPNFPLFQDKTNKHRYLLAQALKQKPGKNGFNIYVQQYKDEQSTPVEIGYNDWNTKMELIGSIVIESPSLNETPEAENFCRGVNFNPWNQVPEYQPIGGVQRLRKVIYNNIQQLRRQYQVETGHSVISGNAVDVTLQQVKQAYPLPNEVKAKTEMELDEAAELDEMSEGEFDEAEFDDAQSENNAEFDEVDEESAAEVDDAFEEFDA